MRRDQRAKLDVRGPSDRHVVTYPPTLHASLLVELDELRDELVKERLHLTTRAQVAEIRARLAEEKLLDALRKFKFEQVRADLERARADALAVQIETLKQAGVINEDQLAFVRGEIL
jgi:hypothetical protein